MRVLVIDSDERLCRRLQAALQLRQCVVAWCTSAAHGLERAMEEVFDLIVMDAQLDDEGDLELCQRLSESSPEALIVTLTELIDLAAVSLAPGAQALATNRLDRQQLLDLIQRSAAASFDEQAVVERRAEPESQVSIKRGALAQVRPLRRAAS